MAELKQLTPSLFFLRATFLRLLFRFAKAFERSPHHVIQHPPADVARMLEAVEISLAQRREFEVDDAATEAGISQRHASRRFRQHVGMSIAQYYQRRRIHLACNLLLDGARSITDIAHELNFADGAHFSRTFVSERGMSPREFRKVFVAAD
jgi:AraC-like DNA-binding protein